MKYKKNEIIGTSPPNILQIYKVLGVFELSGEYQLAWYAEDEFQECRLYHQSIVEGMTKSLGFDWELIKILYS